MDLKELKAWYDEFDETMKRMPIEVLWRIYDDYEKGLAAELTKMNLLDRIKLYDSMIEVMESLILNGTVDKVKKFCKNYGTLFTGFAFNIVRASRFNSIYNEEDVELLKHMDVLDFYKQICAGRLYKDTKCCERDFRGKFENNLAFHLLYDGGWKQSEKLYRQRLKELSDDDINKLLSEYFAMYGAKENYEDVFDKACQSKINDANVDEIINVLEDKTQALIDQMGDMEVGSKLDIARMCRIVHEDKMLKLESYTYKKGGYISCIGKICNGGLRGPFYEKLENEGK